MAEPLGLFEGGYCGWAVFLCSCLAFGGVIWTFALRTGVACCVSTRDDRKYYVRMELAQSAHREILREGWYFGAEDNHISLMGFYGNGTLATT